MCDATAISIIDWNKITEGSNSDITPCVGSEVSPRQHAFVVPSMKCVSSSGSGPPWSKKFPWCNSARCSVNGWTPWRPWCWWPNTEGRRARSCPIHFVDSCGLSSDTSREKSKQFSGCYLRIYRYEVGKSSAGMSAFASDWRNFSNILARMKSFISSFKDSTYSCVLKRQYLY